MALATPTMKLKKEKKLIYRALNFKTFFKYIFEVISITSQGYLLKDKLLLIRHYFKIPIFLIKSLYLNKVLTEIEYQYRILKGNVTIKNRYGIFYCGNNFFTVLPVITEYERHFDPYFKLSEGVFIDIGAHIGKYSIRLANSLKGKGKVYAIEPEKRIFKMLQTNVKLNRLENVTCINKGAYSSKKELTFYVTANPGEMYSSIYKEREDSKVEKIEVDTIDNIINELKISRVDLVKIDTEGAENDVIEGAKESIKKFKPNIIIEVSSSDSLKRITKTLTAFGYDNPISIDEENYYFKATK